MLITDLLVRADELCPGIACEHVEYSHLSPLININHQVAELSVVLVDQVNTLRTDNLKCHHHTTRYQLTKPPEWERKGGGQIRHTRTAKESQTHSGLVLEQLLNDLYQLLLLIWIKAMCTNNILPS